MLSNNKDMLGIILARGGSKRVPGKNKRLLGDKPLIAYTFEAATTSECFKNIVISTDDVDIKQIANSYDIEIDERPENLAGDTVKAVEVILEYLQRTNAAEKYTDVAMMLPTCPFRTAGDIRQAVEIYSEIDSEINSLISVSAYEFPPQLALKKDDKKMAVMQDPSAYLNTRSQSIAPLYHPNGAIYISNIERYLRLGTFFQESMGVYVMPAERSFDIDYEYQFNIAEQIVKNNLV